MENISYSNTPSLKLSVCLVKLMQKT